MPKGNLGILKSLKIVKGKKRYQPKHRLTMCYINENGMVKEMNLMVLNVRIRMISEGELIVD